MRPIIIGIFHFGYNNQERDPDNEHGPAPLQLNRLHSNLSLNNWTFIPGVAYTKILPEANIELTGIWQMEFYTENPATHFQNGILSDLEALAIKRFKNGFGIGFIESWIQQVTDDQGTAADALNGVVGRAFGIGPIATYSTKLGKGHLDLSAR